MDFTMFRRVRTYRMTFRRNGGRSSKSHWLVRMYAAKERETLVIETAHFLYLGCFYCSERFDFHCRRDGWCFAKQQLSGLNNRKRCRQFSGSSAEVTAVSAFPSGEPSESPRHFAASMDESVIVGYYTLKKCLSVAPRCLQIPKKGQKIHGKK